MQCLTLPPSFSSLSLSLSFGFKGLRSGNVSCSGTCFVYSFFFIDIKSIKQCISSLNLYKYRISFCHILSIYRYQMRCLNASTKTTLCIQWMIQQYQHFPEMVLESKTSHCYGRDIITDDAADQVSHFWMTHRDYMLHWYL